MVCIIFLRIKYSSFAVSCIIIIFIIVLLFSHLLPGVEVHACQFAKVGLGDVYVEGLALVDECPTVGRHVDQGTLRELPNSLVQLLQIIRDLLNVLRQRGGGRGREGERD